MLRYTALQIHNAQGKVAIHICKGNRCSVTALMLALEGLVDNENLH